jgi:hypothetical protein
LAHWIIQLLPLVDLHKPINLLQHASDALGWAHWHINWPLLMALPGPILSHRFYFDRQ